MMVLMVGDLDVIEGQWGRVCEAPADDRWRDDVVTVTATTTTMYCVVEVSTSQMSFVVKCHRFNPPPPPSFTFHVDLRLL